MLGTTEKAFRDWLAQGDNAAVLNLRPIKHRSRRCAYRFAGVYPGIQLWIRSSCYDISFEEEDGEYWEMSISDDSSVA